MRKLLLPVLLAAALFLGDEYSGARADVATVAPAGTTQATATTATAQDMLVTSATANQGIVLKALPAFSTASVTNGSSANIKVYPPSGGKINNGTADVAIIVTPGQRATFLYYNATNILANYVDLASGTQDPIFDDPTVDALVATSVTSASNLTSTNVGTVTTGATTVATEYGDGQNHLTKLAMTAFAIGNSADNADLALGAKFYTWPTSVDVLVENAVIDGGVTCAISVTTDTPEVGIGTVVASGANATLTTATWENLVDGGASGSSVDAADVAPDVAGTVLRKKNLTTVQPIIKASGGAARDLFLNIAATWADVTAAGACTFTGNIWLKWRIIG